MLERAAESGRNGRVRAPISTTRPPSRGAPPPGLRHTPVVGTFPRERGRRPPARTLPAAPDRPAPPRPHGPPPDTARPGRPDRGSGAALTPPPGPAHPPAAGLPSEASPPALPRWRPCLAGFPPGSLLIEHLTPRLQRASQECPRLRGEPAPHHHHPVRRPRRPGVPGLCGDGRPCSTRPGDPLGASPARSARRGRLCPPGRPQRDGLRSPGWRRESAQDLGVR